MTEERVEKINQVLDFRQENLTVILENVFDPHNIAAVMRTADAVGVKEMYIVNTILPTYKQFGKRSSSGAINWMMIHEFTNLEDCITAVRKKYNKIYSTHLGTDSVTMHELNLTDSVALAFGNEQKGLTAEFIAHSDGNFIIPQVGMIQSLNISVACAVSLYEAYRQKNVAGHYKQRSLSQAGENELIQFWNDRPKREKEIREANVNWEKRKGV
jgi:tRNA (guanosine-2'-O-)-methyltransferase